MSEGQCGQYLSHETVWMTAISTDDAAKVDYILHNPPRHSTKATLLHTHLSVLPPLDQRLNAVTTNRKTTSRTRFLPFHFAVICYARDVIKCMVQNRVDVTQIDDKGNNVLHTLINASSQQWRNNNENTICMYQLIISLFPEHSIKFCLHHEDTKGLRPLELAASLGHFQLMNAIIHTPGVYLLKREVCGFQLLQYFRVTEYERFSARYLDNRPIRDYVSPLRLLVPLEQCSVDMIQAKSTLLCEPFSTWVLCKIQTNKWFVLLQSSFICMETLLFYFLTRPRWVNSENVDVMRITNHTNITTITPAGFCASVPDHNIPGLTFAICVSVISILINIYGLLSGSTLSQIRKKFTFQNITNSGDCLMLEFCSSISMVLYCLLSIWFSSNTQIATFVFQILYMLILIFTLRRLTRWCLPVTSLQKYAMTVAAVTSELNRIFHVIIIFSLAFSGLLQHLRVLHIPRNLWELPSSYLITLHKTFLLLMNTETVESIETNHYILLQAFHVIGYFSIVVLLFNFIIAVMVNAYSHIRSNFDVYRVFHGLDTTFRCQDRTPIIARWYVYFTQKTFVVENDEIYVVRVTSVGQSNLT